MCSVIRISCGGPPIVSATPVVVRSCSAITSSGTFPIDFPEAVATFPFDVNSRGDIVGLNAASDGTGHGFLLRKDGGFTSIDPPGSHMPRRRA
jgi:hypothetical protein